MTDARVERLADLVVGYSLDLGEGDVVRIDGLDVAAPLLLAIYRSALAAGALPYANVSLDGLLELLLETGSDEQLEYISPVPWKEIETVDALVTIWSEANTRSLTRVDPERHSRYIGAHRRLSNRRWERIAAGAMAWCGTLHPTAAHAQDADMSLEEYETFVFAACHADKEDPADHWRRVAAELGARAASLGGIRELRIVGPDTDLRIGVGGRTWLAAEGRLNMPDGEVFTSPVETETDGEIRFTFPGIFQGREVEDVRLRFEGGRVVAASAAHGEDYLRSLLDMDEGARIPGEVAFGLNYEIDRFTRNILFDEKIGGTMHLALGAAFPQAGGKNTSGLHWDLICDLREEGEVYADGELVWRAGSFLAEPAPLGAG
ncbi:MAG TPA: aminopeptidase [Gaiellaceae bacterium]|jgi:aminopeptidase|nr:aminopeptidase [Gaiellaceae bacterium]